MLPTYLPILLSRGACRLASLGLSGFWSWIICTFQGREICEKQALGIYLFYGFKIKKFVFDYVKKTMEGVFAEQSFWVSDRQVKWNWAHPKLIVASLLEHKI